MRRPGRNAIAALMLAVAASLAVMAALHLGGLLSGDEPFDGTHAGIAEATIGAVLAAGALGLLRGSSRGRTGALAAVVFALAGFLVGLQFTIRGGGAVDVAYHATALPLLLLAAGTLARLRRP